MAKLNGSPYVIYRVLPRNLVYSCLDDSQRVEAPDDMTWTSFYITWQTVFSGVYLIGHTGTKDIDTFKNDMVDRFKDTRIDRFTKIYF